MGRNKKEALVFTSIMCFFMVVIMSFYNVILTDGFSDTLVLKVSAGVLPALAVAWVLDVFVVGKIAKGLALKLVGHDAPMVKKILTISFFMVFGMAASMSVFGTAMHYGVSDHFGTHYIRTFGLNFIMALPLQLVVVGPLTRFLFTRLYPVTPMQANQAG